LETFSLPFRWLGNFISAEERRRAIVWTQTIPFAELSKASYEGLPLSEWIQSSVVSFFRQYPPDFTNWRVVTVYRGFLFSACLVAIGLRNYLKGKRADAAVLFNGRQSITRVAFEILRQNGTRIMTHEMPFYHTGHLNVKPNARCWTLEPFLDLWSAWKDVALSRSQLLQTLRWLQSRRYGRDQAWHPYNPALIKKDSIRRRFKLQPNKQLMALFPSSTDETAGDAELQGPFELQWDWVRHVVEWVRNRDVELVIRVHPHLGGKTGLGKAVQEIEFYQQLQRSAPSNVRIVMPEEELNSYALMDEADVGLTFGSSTGIEMAMLGKPVVLASRGFYEVGSHVLVVRSQDQLAGALDKSLRNFSARDIRREAYRMAYCYVFIFEPPFPLVRKEGVFDVRLTSDNLERLSPGRDQTLDNICDYLIDGKPLYRYPTDVEVSNSAEDEEGFFEWVERTPNYLRDVNREKWIRRVGRMREVAANAKSLLQHVPFSSGVQEVFRSNWHRSLRWMERRF
jgi:hypothetical protein